MNTGASVLLVDDEEFIRRILARIVTREGYQVEEATDGEDALRKLEKQRFDFVISDIRMPKTDGIQLLREIKARFPETMVVLITAYAGEYTQEDVKAAGADDYISKPFKNVEIAETLSSLGNRTKAQKSKRRAKTKGAQP